MSGATLYTRSNGEVVKVADMNDFHLLGAIRKLRAQGYFSSRDVSLLRSAPNVVSFEVKVEPILDALETEALERDLRI